MTLGKEKVKDNWDNLGDTVAAIIQLLKTYEVSGWQDELEEVNHRIMQRWAEGPKLLLDFFGGMGSLTDMYICPENNHKIQEEEVRNVNQTLDKLTSKAYSLAKQLEE
ncbi:MAG: hypothetical protein MUC65_05240 [Pontiellaceae bacterium]|nr:hypothetical protein [Pontiellaceae bacterium]